ncbi:pentatricopeptide repeat-containing protein At1g08070, chloroplastic-like [Aristolochia californica]|uniref:pentatricopeptide repeat-containing protein At1g08070, chloroplastic-like n=1 Tax=Aristolochia californica TaxID=171875 RepID=UPI0035DFA32E
MHIVRPKHFSLDSFRRNERTKISHLLRSPSTTIKQVQQIHALLVVRCLPPPSLFLCNSVLFAYVRSSTPSQAFAFFASQMHHTKPTTVTVQFLLKACSRSKSLFQTCQMHTLTLKLGFSFYTFLQNAIIHCYGLCGQLIDARKVFDELTQRDVVSFNSMIHGYAAVGDMNSASDLFGQVPEPNIVSWTALVTGFSNIGDVCEARRIFDRMPDRDLVSWNAMISGYVQNKRPVEALNLYHQMQIENFKPNTITITSVLSACAGVGALDIGKWIHVYLNKSQFLVDPFLGSSLIDMYSKCGAVDLALQVFENLQEKNTCTWNAMINGLAMSGDIRETLGLFSKMQLDRSVWPDEVTFVGVLLACSHGGFVEEGKRHFYSTMKEYGVIQLVEHYACIVDLLGRSGHLMEAEEVIRSMPIEPDVVVWRALLAGCKLHKNVDLAEKVVSEMEAKSGGDYVLLSNLYASVGRWDDVENMRKTMIHKGIMKVPGCSSIVVNNTIHEFISGDKSHPRYNEILDKLEELGRKACSDGYSAVVSSVLYDIDEEEKEQSLGHHSEKLAIGLGLISTAPGSPLTIMKNLRVCYDCHSMTKFISRICSREIVVRDRIRFHRFKDGHCSCNDYW